MKLLVPLLATTGLVLSRRVPRQTALAGVPVYSTAFTATLAEQGNLAKLSVTTDQDLVLAQASLITAAQSLTETHTFFSGISDANIVLCDDAMQETTGLKYPFAANFQAELSETFWLYAFRYLDDIDWAITKASMTACLEAVNPSNLADLKVELNTAMNDVVVYSGQIGLDWTTMTNLYAEAAPALTLSAANAADHFNFQRLLSLQVSIDTAYDLDYTNFVYDTTAYETINALETTWSFADNDEVTNYALLEGKKAVLGLDNEVDLYEKHQDAINTAFGFTADSDPTLVEITAADAAATLLIEEADERILERQAHYNSSTTLSLGVLLMFVKFFI